MQEKPRKIDPNAETLFETAPNMTPNSVTIDSPRKSREVEEQRQSTKWKTLKTIGAVAMTAIGAGAGSTIIAYVIAPEKFKNLLEKPDGTGEVPVAVSAASAPEQPHEKTVPIPKTPQELLATIKTENIAVDPESFPRKQVNLNGLMLGPGSKEDGGTGLVWKKIEVNAPDLPYLLIATKMENTANARFMGYLYHRPLLWVDDDKDPRIRYHLYACSDEPNRMKRGAAIIMKQGQRRGYMGNVDFMVPYCEKNTQSSD